MVPFVGRHVQNAAQRIRSRVVDKHIQSPKLLDRAPDEARRVFLLSQVALHSDGIAAALVNLTRHLLRASLAGIVMHDHAGTRFGKPPGDTLTQPATSPGNYGDLASKIEERFNGWNVHTGPFFTSSLIIYPSTLLRSGLPLASAIGRQRSNYGGGGGGGVGRFFGVGTTFGVGALLFPGRFFCNSSVILCLTMFLIASPNEGDAVALG